MPLPAVVAVARLVARQRRPSTMTTWAAREAMRRSAHPNALKRTIANTPLTKCGFENTGKSNNGFELPPSVRPKADDAIESREAAPRGMQRIAPDVHAHVDRLRHEQTR